MKEDKESEEPDLDNEEPGQQGQRFEMVVNLLDSVTRDVELLHSLTRDVGAGTGEKD